MTLTLTTKGWQLRLRFGERNRGRFYLPSSLPESEANRRAEALRTAARDLVKAGHLEHAERIIRKAASADSQSLFESVMALAEQLCTGLVAPDSGPARATGETFAELADRWASGKLHKRWPDHVRLKRTADTDKLRLDRLAQTIGTVELSRFTLEDAERAMAALPENLSASTRRQYAQLINRVLSLAVYPCRIIQQNPLPRGFMPKGSRLARVFLYPSEDAKLMRCAEVPLCYRVLYGFLAREGLRSGEARALRWADVDLERGVIKLDENKTDDPRAWALDPGVATALALYRRECPERELVFTDDAGGELDGVYHLAEVFRRHLRAAGVTRPELFQRTKARQPIRIHDLRATFVTLSLAAGRSEAWVQDRTGHRSSQMIGTYRRVARTAAELELGELQPLDSLLFPGVTDRVGQKVGHKAENGTRLDGESRFYSAVGHEGLEPSANGLRVHCSTN